MPKPEDVLQCEFLLWTAAGKFAGTDYVQCKKKKSVKPCILSGLLLKLRVPLCAHHREVFRNQGYIVTMEVSS